MKATGMMKVMGVALVALTGALALAGETIEEVVAYGESSLWLGPDEIVVAYGERGLWLGSDEIVVAYGESSLWLGPDEILVAYSETNFALVVFRDLPANPTEADIRAAIEAAHMKDQARILAQVGGSADRYREFRRWMSGVGEQAVAKSEFAWLSFALDLGTLLESAIEDNDLKVEEFKPTAEAGKFDFTVNVEGVEVGSEASKENLKKVFGLEGTTSLGGAQGEGALPTMFSADAVDISFDTPVNGKVKFTAGPKDADAKTFFMKVKVK